MAMTAESVLALIPSSLKMEGMLPGLNDIPWESASSLLGT